MFTSAPNITYNSVLI